jgi:hypothetical protein
MNHSREELSMRRTSAHTTPRTRPTVSLRRHITSALARAGAAMALLGGLVALPITIVSVVGMPQRGALADAFTTGRLDDQAIVQLGTVLFVALWAWFAATAVTEIARVAAWRARPRSTALGAVNATPSGWVRQLVRVAMISSTTIVGTGLLSVMATSSPARVDAAERSTAIRQLPTSAPGQRAHDTIRSTGRDTPYSIALRLGDATLRARIIELNRGTTSPNGATWTTGVFPEGMSIAVPQGSLDRQQRTWISYRVVEGDSVYRIAAWLSGNDGTRVRQLADEIIERNLGRVMNDGALFEDPSLIRVGWQIEIPGEPAVRVLSIIDDAAGAPIDDQPLHTVQRGESYWSIAEDHLVAEGLPAVAPAVAALTDELIAINEPLLGHDRHTLIVPGDQLHWPAIEVAVAAGAPAATPAFDSPVRDAPPIKGPPSDHSPATTLPEAPVMPAHVHSDPIRPPFDTPSVSAHAAGHSTAPMTLSLGAAVLLCAGALGLVESRRRHQLRRAPAGATLLSPTDRDITTERLLRTLPAAQRAMRLDLALRSAGHHLAGTGAHVLAVTMTESGTISLILHRPERATPASPWQSDVVNPGQWTVDASVDTDLLIDSARLAGQPCPALVHLGTMVVDDRTAPGTALFVDLEAFGLLSIDSEAHDSDSATAATNIVGAIAASLACSPVGETLRLVTHELGIETHLGNLNAEAAETIDAAIDCAAAALGSTPTMISGRRTFELRARGVGGEAWEPVIIVSAATDHDAAAVQDLVAVSRGGGRGLAAVMVGPVEGAGLTLTAAPSGWQVAPLGLNIVPVGLPPESIRAVHDLLDAADRPLAAIDPNVTPRPTAEPFIEPAWQLVVRVLGQVDVTDREGHAVAFDRGKALELAAWLSLHRERPTRAAARTALWDMQVRDATFANVVSDARRAMARTVSPPRLEEWIERTLTEQLPLHALVTSDADLLRARLDASRGMAAHDAIDMLRPGVEWITDMPFAGTGYLWPDAEGITSELTLLATAGATELARHCLSIGDVEGVFWATGRGLQVLSGHEELIGLRMRAYAQRGDLAGVRSEWEVYERAIHADPWSSGEPSPKLVAIRRELLSH